ncbi:MAG TPA: hypothetical protein VHT26_03705 [Trebonia sp.]|jgi:hypothetical protein|nr:hypothetical protein [Trebonia sp.]
MKQWGDYERPPGDPEWRSWQPSRYDPAAHLERLGYFQQPVAPSWEPAAAPSRPGYDRPPQVPRPGQGPRRAPGGKSWVARNKVFTIVAAAGSVICVACVALAAESATPAAGATATTAAAPRSCAAQVQDWVDGGAVQRIDFFGGDLGSFAAAANAFAADLGDGGASAGDVSGIRSTAAAIQSDAQGVQANLGPACVPGLRSNLAAAAGDYSKAAADAQHGMNQYTAGDMNDAGSQIGAAGLAIGNGNAKLALATVAVSRYRASRG